MKKESKSLEIEGTKYWMGLTWSVITDGRNIRKTIEAARKEAPKGLWTLIPHEEISLFGFAPAPSGREKISGKSLALSILYAKDESWMGTFRIDENLYWFVAIREKAVLEHGDFVGTLEDIAQIREEYEGYGDWQYIEDDIGNIQSLIEQSLDRSDAVPSVHRFVNWKLVTGISLAVGVSFLGVLLGLHYHNLMKLTKEMQLRRERAAWDLAHKKPPLAPWEKIRPFTETLSLCEHSIKRLPIVRKGWQPVSIRCTPIGITVTWKALAHGLVDFAPEGNISNNGLTDVESRPFPPFLPEKGNPGTEKPIEYSEFLRKVYLLGSRTGSLVSRPSGVTSRPSWEKKKNIKTFSWQHVSLDITSLRPESVAAFEAIPTLRIGYISSAGGPDFHEWKFGINVWTFNK